MYRWFCARKSGAKTRQMAIDAPRWRFVEGLEIACEDTMPTATLDALTSLGHTVSLEAPDNAFGFGGAQLICRLGDTGYSAGSDPRKDGHAVGFLAPKARQKLSFSGTFPNLARNVGTLTSPEFRIFAYHVGVRANRVRRPAFPLCAFLRLGCRSVLNLLADFQTSLLRVPALFLDVSLANIVHFQRGFMRFHYGFPLNDVRNKIGTILEIRKPSYAPNPTSRPLLCRFRICQTRRHCLSKSYASNRYG